MYYSKKYFNMLKEFVLGISDDTVILLRSVMPFIVAQLLHYIAEMSDTLKISPTYAYYYYPDVFGGIFKSLLVLIVGAVISDIFIKRNCRED